MCKKPIIAKNKKKFTQYIEIFQIYKIYFLAFYVPFTFYSKFINLDTYSVYFQPLNSFTMIRNFFFLLSKELPLKSIYWLK